MMWNDLHMWPKWLFNGMFFFGGIIILIIYVSIDPLPKVVTILYIIEITDIHLEHINYPKVF